MINEKVSVRDFKEFESDIRGIGLLNDLINIIDVKDLRYISIERTDLTISLDNVKTLLAGLTNSENYQGVSIVTMRFYNGQYATAIIQYRGLTNFDALVFSSTTATLPPYNLSYIDGSWNDYLLASGRQTADSVSIVSTIPNNTWTSIRKITLTPGVWIVNANVYFTYNATGGVRGCALAEIQDSNQAIIYDIRTTSNYADEINLTTTLNVVGTKDYFLTSFQTSGGELNTNGKLTAYRLS